MIPLATVLQLRRSARIQKRQKEVDPDTEEGEITSPLTPGPTTPTPSPPPTRQPTEETQGMGDSLDVFWGDGKREQEEPTMWMQRLHARAVANDWAEIKRIEVFESLLTPGKTALRWWNELPATVDKSKWAIVRTEFAKRWVPLPDLDDDVDRKREELETLTLEASMLATKVKFRGQEAYTHVVFAEEAFRLGTDIGDDKGFLVATVRKRLLEAVRELVRRERMQTWKQFHEAISTIPVSALIDEIKQVQREHNLYADVNALKSQRTGLTPAFGRTSFAFTAPTTPQRITQPPSRQTPPNTPQMPATPTRNSTNPFSSTPATQRNAPFSPSMHTTQNQLQSGGAAQVWNQGPFADSAQGQAAYQVAFTAWIQRNGMTGRSSNADPIPLRPGTAPAGSNECYACGLVKGHTSRDCLEPKKVPHQERQWRAYCGYLAIQERATRAGNVQQTPTPMRTAQIQHIGDEYPQYAQLSPTADQGNGEESTV